MRAIRFPEKRAIYDNRTSQAVLGGMRSQESSQVKSSQVKFKFQWRPRPPPLGAPAGARDREGAARRNWHGWIALSRGFIHIVFFLFSLATRAVRVRTPWELPV